MTGQELRDVLAALHHQPARVIERATALAEQLMHESPSCSWAAATAAAAISALRAAGVPTPIRPKQEPSWRTLARELLDGGWGLWVGEQVFCAGLLLQADAGEWDIMILRGIAERHGAISAEAPL